MRGKWAGSQSTSWRDALRAKHFTNGRAGQPQSWYIFAAGISGFSYSTSFTGNYQLRVELYLGCSDMEKNKRAVKKLHKQREAIELEFVSRVSGNAWTVRRQRVGRSTDPA